MMNPPNQPTAAAQAAQAAARLAGYSQFYGTGQPGFAPAPSMRPLPPGVSAPPGSFGRPPPPPHAFPRGTPPPPNMMMRPPPPRPQAANQWQWSNGQAASATTVVASAPPVRFPLPPRNHLGPPPRGFSNAGPPAKPAPAFGAASQNGAGPVLNTKWPDSLHDYVKRAFARCKGAADQALTQQALKELITNAITANNLWTRNWHVEPLPTLVGDTIPARMANAQPTPMHQPGFHKFNANSANPVANAFAAMESNKLKRKHTGGIEGAVEDVAKKNQRRQRFHKDKSELAKLVTPTVDTKKLRVLNEEGELDLDAMVIKGTCQTVEKEYLRLTSAPHPSTVRPEPILKEALALVKKKWKKGKCDYIYACSQLKSIRQDCTVQHIKNDFTVLVYETHARVALESGDINEFNQCQTQLHELYEQALPGQAIEFLAYRVLYSVYVSLQAKKADSNAGVLGMYSVLSSITDKLRADPVITHALAVRAAVAQNDYHRFFRLYVNAPNMAGYLMDPMVPAIRLAALRAMCKAYRPSLSLQFIRDELKLEGKDGEEFIAKSGLAFMKGNKEVIDTKNSDIVWVLSDQSSLI